LEKESLSRERCRDIKMEQANSKEGPEVIAANDRRLATSKRAVVHSAKNLKSAKAALKVAEAALEAARKEVDDAQRESTMMQKRILGMPRSATSLHRRNWRLLRLQMTRMLMRLPMSVSLQVWITRQVQLTHQRQRKRREAVVQGQKLEANQTRGQKQGTISPGRSWWKDAGYRK
jgi:hypothetical protein